MAHGYLRDWDERWGRSNERERSDRDWRSRDDDRNWNRDPGDTFMLGDREYPGSRDDDRWSDRARSDWERAPRNFRSHQDDHYLSWRDRQMDALDRDYADYCREREQQFHRDFDNWRNNRQQNAGSKQQQQGGESEELILAAEDERVRDRAMAGQGTTPSAEGAATLGTNNPENAFTGRGGR